MQMILQAQIITHIKNNRITMVKAHEIRTKDEKALAEDLAKLKAELAKARIGKVAATAAQVKASKIKVCL